MSIASVKQFLMNGVTAVHRISCTATEPRHGQEGTARDTHGTHTELTLSHIAAIILHAGLRRAYVVAPT
jgi:hypothetical protein